MSRNVPNAWVDSLGVLELWNCLFALPGLPAAAIWLVTGWRPAGWVAARFHLRDDNEPYAPG